MITVDPEHRDTPPEERTDEQIKNIRRVGGGRLPSTGTDSEGALPWVVLLLAVGGLAVLVDRRRLIV